VMLISAVAAIGAIILLIVSMNLKSNSSNNVDFYPLTCQKFTYSDWSACQVDGTQSREIVDRLPANCQGGFPDVVRGCNK